MRRALCCALTVASARGAPPAAAARRAPSAAAASQPFVLWNTSVSNCQRDGSPIDLPDTPARAFVGAGGRTEQREFQLV